MRICVLSIMHSYSLLRKKNSTATANNFIKHHISSSGENSMHSFLLSPHSSLLPFAVLHKNPPKSLHRALGNRGKPLPKNKNPQRRISRIYSPRTFVIAHLHKCSRPCPFESVCVYVCARLTPRTQRNALRPATTIL